MYKVVQVALFVAAAISAVVAQDVNFLAAETLKTPTPDVLATVLELVFAPGQKGLIPHRYSGPVVGYAVEGDFLYQVKGEAPKIVSAGSAFFEKDVVQLWGANASNSTEGRLIIFVYGRPAEPILQFTPLEPRDDYATALAKAKAQ